MTDTEQLILAIERCMFTSDNKLCSCTEKAEKFIEARLSGYKAQVAGQAKYIGHLLTEIADYKERVFDYEKRIAEFLK